MSDGTKTVSDELFGCLGRITGVVVMLVCMSVYHGWAFAILWRWFYVPLGLPEVGVAQAIGMALLVDMVTYRSNKDEKIDWLKSVSCAIVIPLVVLGVGYVAHRCM